MACYLATPEALLLGFSAHGRGGVGHHRHSALHRGREVRRRRLSAGAKAAAAGKSKNGGGTHQWGHHLLFFFGPLIGIYRDIIWIMIGMYCLVICCIAMEECCL